MRCNNPICFFHGVTLKGDLLPYQICHEDNPEQSAYHRLPKYGLSYLGYRQPFSLVDHQKGMLCLLVVKWSKDIGHYNIIHHVIFIQAGGESDAGYNSPNVFFQNSISQELMLVW